MRQNNEKQQQKASPQTPAQQSRSQQTAPTSRPQQQPEQQPVFSLPDGDISEIDYSEGMDDALFAGVVAEDAGLMPDQG